MAKQLLIMRHAKSSWSDTNATDFQRKLNERGRKDAPRMGQLVTSNGYLPDWIITSSAQRAKETTQLFVEGCGESDQSQVSLNDDFYHAPSETYLEYLHSFDDETAHTLMFVGHNPGMEELVSELCGNHEVMPTAAIAVFSFSIDTWVEAADVSKPDLLELWRPKHLF